MQGGNNFYAIDIIFKTFFMYNKLYNYEKYF